MAKFKIGDKVIDPNSSLGGTVINVEEPSFPWMSTQYRVVLTNGTSTRYSEDALQPDFNIDDVFELCKNRNFASYDEYMIVNTLFKIDNVNNNTISTLRASRTQFNAYQFKPLLKFFSSPERRILIADEVGLGKTIEAGHILLELRARKEFRNALIICPKSLREKWKSEMKLRFGIDFTIYGGEDNDGMKYPSKSDLYNAYKEGRDVHAIINYEAIRYKEARNKGEEELEEPKDKVSREKKGKANLIEFLLENKIQQSVVICDESHRLRNEGTLTYKGAVHLLSKSDAVLFLSATPVMIREENLYNQMHLLCPEKYSNGLVFCNRMAQGRPFVFALNALMSGYEPRIIWERLHNAKIKRSIEMNDKDPITQEMTVEEAFWDDPIYKRIKTLFDSPNTAKMRVNLQLNLMKMSAIQNEYSRTTKKQAGAKTVKRCPSKVEITLTPEEQKMFDKYNQAGNTGLGLVQIRRMLASSVYGYCRSHNMVGDSTSRFEELPDAKVDKLLNEILRPSPLNGNRELKKVIVFAVFIDTLIYLKHRLERKGIKSALIDGSVSNRQEVIDRFQADDSIRVLLSSEVGSEGLDMQFCDTIVNYDLPWNPMVVEQRIGRIDRIGQKSEKIYIYNFVVKGSILESIYDKLQSRIDIFKGTIGDLEPILSATYKDGISILEADSKLEQSYYLGELTEEQVLKEEELIEQAIEAQRLILKELSGEMAKHDIANDPYYMEQIALIQKRKSYVTAIELRNLLKRILSINETRCSQCVLETPEDNSGVCTLRIPQNFDDRGCLENFLKQNRPESKDSLKAYDAFVKDIHGKTELSITFDQDVANENHSIVFVNNYSPLILACNEFRRKAGVKIQKAFKFELHPETDILKAGSRYFLLTYQLEISDSAKESAGVVKELFPVLFDVAQGELVSDDAVISEVCSLAQDLGRETQMPSSNDCSPMLVSKFKALATDFINKIVTEKKSDLEEQNNVERKRWIKEFSELYDGKIKYYQGVVKECEESLRFYAEGDVRRKELERKISSNTGTITRLRHEKEKKIEKLNCESKVSILREEVAICYVVIK